MKKLINLDAHTAIGVVVVAGVVSVSLHKCGASVASFRPSRPQMDSLIGALCEAREVTLTANQPL